jgi:hypothetical protein
MLISGFWPLTPSAAKISALLGMAANEEEKWAGQCLCAAVVMERFCGAHDAKRCDVSYGFYRDDDGFAESSLPMPSSSME